MGRALLESVLGVTSLGGSNPPPSATESPLTCGDAPTITVGAFCCRGSEEGSWTRSAPSPRRCRPALARSSVVRARALVRSSGGLRGGTEAHVVSADTAWGWRCVMHLSLIHISEPTRRTPISY